MKLGFVGAGAMGMPMIRRLLPEHEVAVFDVAASRLAELEKAGARPARTAADAARDAEATILMVASPDQLRDALHGPAGVAESATPGSIVVIMSTVGTDAAAEAAARLGDRGIHTVDAPVTGGVVRAESGELTLLLAGHAEDIAAIDPALRLLGTRRPVCGERVGDGQAVKLVNQLLCTVHLVAAAEALSLARALQLDAATVLSVVETGAAGSFMLSDRGPRMLETDPPVLSAVDIFVKDAGLVADSARQAALAVPVLEAARSRILSAQREGLGRSDDSCVIRTYTAAERAVGQDR
jgi:3-hydroxyisobutyrate dehydrogenase-like beta-hydroxyacid dehydrogenase